LFEFLENYLDDACQKDRNALGLRLLLREGGEYVIGFVPEKELKRMVKQKRKVIGLKEGT
jgi:hypothetical protein